MSISGLLKAVDVIMSRDDIAFILGIPNQRQYKKGGAR